MKYLMIALLMSAAAVAQPVEGEKPAFPPSLEKFLGLAEGQADAIVDANEQFRTDPIRKEKIQTLRQMQRDLKAAINADSPDAGVIGTLAVDIEMLDRDLRAEAEAFQQDMLADILGVSPDDEEPADVLKRLKMLERAKKLEPVYKMAVRFHLVDSPRQMKQQRREGDGPPPAE